MRSRLISATSLVAIGMFLAPSLAAAGEIAWHRDVNAAWQTAVDQQTPMLIFVSSPGCKYCKMMKRNTLSNPEIARQVNQSFVPVAIEANRAGRLVKDLGVRAFPTMLVISPEAVVVARIQGYVAPRELMRRLDATVRNGAQMAQHVSRNR